MARLLAVEWDQLKAQLRAISQPVLYANGIHDVMIPAIGSYKAVELAGQGIRVTGLHVGYLDTDMVREVDSEKSDPADIARIAVEGIAAGAYEILGYNASLQAQAALADGVAAIYPELP